MKDGIRQMARWSAALGCALVVVAATMSVAYADDEPTRGIMEFKLGPYMPMIDNEFDDNGPYQTFFNSRSMLYGEMALDYHLWQGIGKLSLGVHAGYGRISAAVTDQDGQEIDSEERSALRIIPLRTSLVYRYDYSAHNHGVPLVPVAKAGLNYYMWSVLDAGGDRADADGRTGSGGMMGWHATLGLHFHLDFLDPRSSAAFDMSWGIKNSYIFAEYTWSRVGGFSDGDFDLGANHWSAGLAFEF